MKFSKEKDPTLKTLHALRAGTGFISAGLTIAAAFSYCSPLLTRVALGYAESSLRYWLLTWGAGVALRWGARVRLLVWVARFNWIGLAWTVGEIGYLLFRDDDLQNWFESCVFRKDKEYRNFIGTVKVHEYFPNAKKELEELEKATRRWD